MQAVSLSLSIEYVPPCLSGLVLGLKSAAVFVEQMDLLVSQAALTDCFLR